MKLNHYARLKEDNVCIEIITTPKNLKGVKGYVSIPDYNETLLYRKWDEVTGWSEEKYEPEIDAVLQERIQTLEEMNSTLIQENTELRLALAELAESNESKITELQMAIAELAEMGV